MDCPKCKFEGSKEEVISHHTRKHKGGEKFYCDECEGTPRYDSPTAFLQHRIQTHGESVEEIPDKLKDKVSGRKKYRCKTCGNSFRQYEYMSGGENPKYCSPKCYYEDRDGEKITFNCAYCDEKVEKYKSQISQNRKEKDRIFCSTKCVIWFYHGKSEDLYYGDSWDEKRELCIERDYSRCRLCNISRSECKNIFETDLHVHHRTPLRNFDDIEKANRLRNLITLCPRCHAKMENEIQNV